MLCGLVVGTVPAAGQRVSGSLAAGVSRVEFAESPGVSAASLSPALLIVTARNAVGASGVVAHLGAGAWSVQGTAVGARYTAVSAAGLMGEIGVVGGGSRHSDGAGTAQALAHVRGHRVRGASDLWIGAGGGGMWDGTAWRAVAQAELGATASAERLTLTTFVAPTVAAAIRYADATVSAEYRVGAVDVGASFGARAGGVLPVPGGDARVWGGVSVVRWFAPTTAVVVSAGTYPVDLTQGFPSARYATVALRFGGRRRGDLMLGSTDRRDRRLAAREGVTAHRCVAMAGTERVQVRAAGATHVELTGDATAWVPTALRAVGNGWWALDVPLEPGAQELTVRVDGGAWVIPPGLAVVVDEFGGRVGRLLVPCVSG